MELPKHSCISCAYLLESESVPIKISHRENALNDKLWNNFINYQLLVCYKERLPNFYKLGKPVVEIRNRMIEQNTCKHWRQFSGVSPIAVEQREATKWVFWTFWIVLITLVVIVITWILSQFVLTQ